MRGTVIILKTQFVLQYRMAHPGYSVACLIPLGSLLYRKVWNRALQLFLREEYFSQFLLILSGKFNCSCN